MLCCEALLLTLGLVSWSLCVLQEICEDFALEIFAKADDEDRAGAANKYEPSSYALALPTAL